MFGAAVNLAARVTGQASGGQTLVTRPVANAARQDGRTVVPIGTFTLRNVADPQELFEVSLGPPRAAGSVDPVCRMWVEHGRASGFLHYSDSDYWFCSLACGESLWVGARVDPIIANDVRIKASGGRVQTVLREDLWDALVRLSGLIGEPEEVWSLRMRVNGQWDFPVGGQLISSLADS